jgi:hypothetical protein
LTASFTGTPAGVAPIAIRAEMDEVQADVAAGFLNEEIHKLYTFEV